MEVEDCAIASGGQALFTASVFDRPDKPVRSFSLMAATTGRVSQSIAPHQWTQISATFADGTFCTMPTPEF